MTSPADARTQRLRQLEKSILAAAPEPPDTEMELSELSMHAHRAIVTGTFGNEPTQLRVRLHGKGVPGHEVPADQAGTVLAQTQLLVRWIGARLRKNGDDKQMRASKGERLGVKEATRLFLRPQFGAGSLIFDLVGRPNKPQDDEAQRVILDGAAQINSLLDRSLAELIAIVTSAESDASEDLGSLSERVSMMGPRVAAQLKNLSAHVTDEDIDIELRWLSSGGHRKRANLSRRGALVIADAVDRNKVRIDEIVLTGLLETASTGKDQIRIESADEVFKMDVEEELGVTLGAFLHQEVTAVAERTRTWHNSGKETVRYRLLSLAPEPQMVDEDDDGSEDYVRPFPDER